MTLSFDLTVEYTERKLKITCLSSIVTVLPHCMISMDENHNVEKSGSQLTEEEIAARRSEADEERIINEHIWKNCCEIHEDEANFISANLHYAFVKQKQFMSRGRWPEIMRLRAMEVEQNRDDLVDRFECWMRKLDRTLTDQGWFVGSYTKKYMVCSVSGPIPTYKYWSN